MSNDNAERSSTGTKEMAEAWVLKALRSRTKSLNLDNSQIRELSPSLGQLDFLTSLSAKSNELRSLPNELGQLKRVGTRSLRLRNATPDMTCFASVSWPECIHITLVMSVSDFLALTADTLEFGWKPTRSSPHQCGIPH